MISASTHSVKYWICIPRSGNGEGYTSKRLKQKLKEHYGDNVTITTSSGRPIIYSFCGIEHNILRDNWKSARDPKSPTDKDSIISAAASIIRNDISTTPYDCSEYPRMDDLSDCASLVPESLLLFLHAIIKSNMDASNSDRRCVAIAHHIISACRPRSFISPLLLAVAVYVHRKYGSRELVDILNRLGFSDDYKEVQRLNSIFVVSGEPEYNLQSFTQFVFDNADFTVATLTSHDTFHAMGGIAAVTPSGNSTPRTLQRNTQLPAMEEMGQFSTVPLRIYRKPSQSAMKSVIIGPLEPPVEEPTNLKSAKLLDTLWATNFVLGVSPVLCPFWSGVMQLSVRGEDCDKSRIEILPFVNQDPSQPNTIYSALYFAQKLIDHHNLGTCPVTFDQPLYIKATGIVASVTDLPNIFIRIGGFHLTMSYMGSLGFIMAGSGLESMWETVYAPNSIPHMQTGHAYARALRAHILSAAVITSLLLENPGCLTGVNIQNLGATKAALFDGELASNCLHNQESVPQVMQVIDDLMLSNYAGSRTGKLWVNYLIQVYYLKLLLFAERTGDCELDCHVSCCWSLCLCKSCPALLAANEKSSEDHDITGLWEICRDGLFCNQKIQ